MMQFLSGKKTYIVAVLMVIQGILNLFTGDVSVVEFVQSPNLRLLLEGMGLASLRAGVAKSIKLI